MTGEFGPLGWHHAGVCRDSEFTRVPGTRPTPILMPMGPKPCCMDRRVSFQSKRSRVLTSFVERAINPISVVGSVQFQTNRHSR